MSFTFFQMLLAGIAVLFFAGTVSKFLKGEQGQTLFKLLLSLFTWGGVFLFSLAPQLGRSLSERLGMGSNLNTLIFIGFITLFIIIFKLLNIIERIERNISEIVRKEALKKIQK